MDLSTRQGRRIQGQRLQSAAENAGFSIEELAGRIGCSRALLYQYVSGTTLAQPDRLQQIAQQCRVPLAYFYADGDETESAEAPTASRNLLSPATNLPSAPEEISARLADSLHSMETLAEAQEGPPDYHALASTCERILSLAVQLDDRAAQARAQLRLGNALLSTADYSRAAEALKRATTLAGEIGARADDIAARQSLGKALAAMGRTEEAREQFSRIAQSDDFSGRWQGTLSLGCIHEMRGEYRQAMECFDAASALLEEGESSGLATPKSAAIGRLYVNANRVNVYIDGGDFTHARPLSETCLHEAESLGIAEQHLEARINLAVCDFALGAWDSAYHNLTTMLQLARFVGDAGRETLADAWLSGFLAAAGDHDSAIARGKDALAWALSHGDRRVELYAQLALSDAYIGRTHRVSEARYHTSQALAVATALRHERDEAECRLRIARLSAQSEEIEELESAAARALNLARQLGARHLEGAAHLWLAEGLRLKSRFLLEGESKQDVTTNAGNRDSLMAQAEQEAATALIIAGELGLADMLWRTHLTLAQLALQAAPPKTAVAEDYLRNALVTLEMLRTALREAGMSDTLLENHDCAVVYETLVQLLLEMGRAEEAGELLEQTGWPPLTARFTAETENFADQP